VSNRDGDRRRAAPPPFQRTAGLELPRFRGQG
jgi:hypothetical protein